MTNLTLEVSSVDPELTQFVLGDRFELSFVLEDSVMDGNPSLEDGVFPALVTSWSMTADPGNVGTWTPSGTPAPALCDCTTDELLSLIGLQIGGMGYPDGGVGWGWLGFYHRIAFPPGIVDTGSGQTLAEQLAAPLATPPAVHVLEILFDDMVGGGAPRIARLTPAAPQDPLEVPVNSLPALLVLIGALGWIGLRRLG